MKFFIISYSTFIQSIIFFKPVRVCTSNLMTTINPKPLVKAAWFLAMLQVNLKRGLS